VLGHVLVEAVGVETDSRGVLAEMLIVKGMLMLEEGVMHLPEPALLRRCLGRFRRVLRMRADLPQREGFISRNSGYFKQLCGLCAEICDRCATQCERYQDDVCQRCAKACRACAEQCRVLAV